MKTRSDNRKLIIDTITECKKWNNQFIFIEPEKEMSPSWFGLPILINKRLKKKKTTLLRLLDKKNIENRPIVSGNFLNQPAIKLYNLSTKNKFYNSQLVEESGFFIGLHTKKITKKMANYIATNLLKIDEI